MLNCNAVFCVLLRGHYSAPAAYTKEKRAEEARRKRAEEARCAAETAQAGQTIIACLEMEAPAAFAGFLAYVADQRRAVEAKCARLPASILARMLQEFDTPAKRRELFRAWQQRL